jgi:hypothetical protein
MSLLRSGSWLLPCPARRGGGAPPPSPKPAQAGAVANGKPQRGWWLGVRATPAWRPFESRQQAARGGNAPRTPGRSPGGAGGARGQRSGSPWMRAVRAVGSLPPPRSIPTPRACTGPRRADRLAGAAVPSRAPARCGSVDRLPGKSEGERGRKEREAVADMWSLPSSESGKVDAAGGAGGLSLGCWAGRLSGSAAGFRKGRPSKGVPSFGN